MLSEIRYPNTVSGDDFLIINKFDKSRYDIE